MVSHAFNQRRPMDLCVWHWVLGSIMVKQKKYKFLSPTDLGGFESLFYQLLL